MMIYLDNNATTPIDSEVQKTFFESLQTYGNPSSIYSLGREARKKIERSRDIIASYLNVKPSEIIFTSSGTEGNNMLLRGFFGFFPKGHIITSALEHPATLKTVQALEKAGVNVTYLASNAYGAPSVQEVEKAILPDTKLIFLMAVNNETGVRTDIKGISTIAQSYNIPFFVDGVQLLGKASFSIPEGVDAMVFSGHKIYAPKGIGAVFVRRHIQLEPYLTGGHQERGRRAGTENVPGIIAFGKAIECLQIDFSETLQRIERLRNYFENELLDIFESIAVNGEGPRVGNTSNLAFLGHDGESLLQMLDSKGICASLGSACASGALEPSTVLLAMGYSRERVKSSIRFSLGRTTTEMEIDKAIQIIKALLVSN